MQTVAAAVIWVGGKILIAQRSALGPHPLKWEFPGGKAESGETAAQALVRELQEELGIEAVPGVQFASYEYAYPLKPPILLIFYEVTSFKGVIENQSTFEKLVWIQPQDLLQYDFLEGDLPLIQLLGKVHVNQV